MYCFELSKFNSVGIVASRPCLHGGSSINCAKDKKNPLKGVSTSLTIEDYQNKSLILVDDVLNSGSTLIYGVKHFLEVPLKKFQTAVLVDRSHKKFPVKADVKGLSLSTSLNETIKVSFGKTNKAVLVE